MSDPFVIIEGGLVQNDPNIEVFDMDFLEDCFVDLFTYEQGIETLKRLEKHRENYIKGNSQFTLLSGYINSIKEWVESNSEQFDDGEQPGKVDSHDR